MKERLYRPDIHGIENRQSGQYALYYTLLNILKLYAIYVPHITEYIYQRFFRQYEKEKSLHLLLWEQPENVDTKLLAFGDMVKEQIAKMRKYKSENNLSMKSEMETLVITTKEEFLPMLAKTEKDLLSCAGAKRVTYQVL